MRQIAAYRRRTRAGVEDARRHLEESRAEAPAVQKLAADLRYEMSQNSFARRVHASLRGGQ